MINLPTKIGEKINVTGANGATGCICKHRQNLFSLNDDNNPYRNRWGTAQEILADLTHFQTFGKLPPPSSPRW
jgi:hypothetical protein